MVWPGMGSEVRFLSSPLPPSFRSDATRNQQVVFELYSTSSSKNKAYFVRVLWGGQPMETSTPLGTLNNVPVNDFFNCKSLAYT
jgi:acid phosphatase